MAWPPRKKDYPKELLVKDAIYTIHFQRKLNARDDLGLCDSSVKKIHIKLKQNLNETLHTFIHEVLHAIEEEYGFEIEHKIIHKLEEPLARLIFDNFI